MGGKTMNMFVFSTFSLYLIQYSLNVWHCLVRPIGTHLRGWVFFTRGHSFMTSQNM